MSVINTNIAATLTANSMRENQRTMENTMERLATGKRINSASDDAAGLAIETRMDSQIRGLSQASRNANDGISMLQTADGAVSEVSDMLQRMRELSVQSRTGTLSADDVTNLDQEFAQLATEIDRIVNDTTFNDIKVLQTSQTIKIGVGADELDTIDIAMADFNLTDGTAGTTGTAGSVVLAQSIADMRTDLSAGAITFTDGTATISVSLLDVQTTANNGALTALVGGTGTVTDDQIVAALNVKANANDNFSVNFAVSVADTSLTLTEKSGFFAQHRTITTGGSGDGDTATVASGVASTGVGAMNTNLSTFKTVGSPVGAGNYNVNTDGTIALIDNAIKGIAAERANFGALINRLEYTVDNLNTTILNTKAAKSQIVDADYAAETTELARTQIISQASTAMLSQANQAAQSVLALLK
jgi:flagellin